MIHRDYKRGKCNEQRNEKNFGTGAAIGFVAIVAMMAQFMISNHLFGGSDASSEIFTRATYPNGFLLVILIPLVATAALFYGIIRKK